jgi:hypothetical protein
MNFELISDFAFATSRDAGCPTLPSEVRRTNEAWEPIGLRGSRRSRPTAKGKVRRFDPFGGRRPTPVGQTARMVTGQRTIRAIR